MLRVCSWSHSDRHPRNWNYLRICGSLRRAVAATCKSKHPWQSKPRLQKQQLTPSHPGWFHPFVPISIWQLVSLGLICGATQWFRDSFTLCCFPSFSAASDKPMTCKQQNFKRLWNTSAQCSQMFLRVRSVLDTPAPANQLEGPTQNNRNGKQVKNCYFIEEQNEYWFFFF